MAWMPPPSGVVMIRGKLPLEIGQYNGIPNATRRHFSLGRLLCNRLKAIRWCVFPGLFAPPPLKSYDFGSYYAKLEQLPGMANTCER